MNPAKRLLTTILMICVSVAPCVAQIKLPPETRNAALRYWMAFAELQDTRVDKSIADLLEKTLQGDAAWDEGKLGAIVDDNVESIEIMQRATKLPECDWGLEYSLGANTPIPFVKNSARALARLNTLYGIRLAATGKTQQAIETWLAGIHFSQDLAKGGSLFATLVATSAFSSDLKALIRTIQGGVLTGAERQQVAAVVRELPESAFDWGQAMWYEELAIDAMTRNMAEATSPTEYYQRVVGESTASDFTVPKSVDLAAFHKFMVSVQASLRLPPEQAGEKLQALQNSENVLHPFFRKVTPKLEGINNVRLQIQAQRRTLLELLAK